MLLGIGDGGSGCVNIEGMTEGSELGLCPILDDGTLLGFDDVGSSFIVIEDFPEGVEVRLGMMMGGTSLGVDDDGLRFVGCDGLAEGFEFGCPIVVVEIVIVVGILLGCCETVFVDLDDGCEVGP